MPMISCFLMPVISSIARFQAITFLSLSMTNVASGRKSIISMSWRRVSLDVSTDKEVFSVFSQVIWDKLDSFMPVASRHSAFISSSMLVMCLTFSDTVWQPESLFAMLSFSSARDKIISFILSIMLLTMNSDTRLKSSIFILINIHFYVHDIS